jgi:Amt family ammonium transporter
MVYSFVGAFLIGMIIKKTIGFRVDEEAEVTGIDESEHAETGYDFSTLGGRLGSDLGGSDLGGGPPRPPGPSGHSGTGLSREKEG